MATLQLHPMPQSSYKSPYSYFVSTYGKWPVSDRGGLKVIPGTARSNEQPVNNLTSSHCLVDREQIANNVVSCPDDSSLDVDELISSMMQQKDITTSGTIGETDVEVGSDSSVAYPTKGGTQDLVTTRIESKGDHSTLEVDLTAIHDSDPLCADSDSANSNGLGSRTTLTSKLFVANHKDNDNHGGIIDSARLQLAADLPTSAFRRHGSFVHQASRIQVNTETTPGRASYIDLGVIKEAEDDSTNTLTTERSDPSAVSNNKIASDYNVSITEQLAGQYDPAQTPQPGSAAAPLHQSDLSSEVLLRHPRQQEYTKIVRRKRLRTPTPTRPAITVNYISDALDPNTFECTQSVGRSASSAKEPEIRDIDQEMASDGGISDLNDEDYCEVSDPAPSKVRGRPRSRKRVKRAKYIEHNGIETPSTQTLNVSCQAVAATSSINMHESEEMPIRGSLTLKTVGSRVIYCLTFSQEVFPESVGTLPRQGIPRSVSPSSDRIDSERLSIQEGAIRGPVKKSQFSTEEDTLLRQMKEEGFSWDEIKDRFSDRFHERGKGFNKKRSKGTLQVHYSTKLKHRSERDV